MNPHTRSGGYLGRLAGDGFFCATHVNSQHSTCDSYSGSATCLSFSAVLVKESMEIRGTFYSLNSEMQVKYLLPAADLRIVPSQLASFIFAFFPHKRLQLPNKI